MPGKLARFLDIARLAIPAAGAFIPELAPFVPFILRGVEEADKLDAPGEEKRAHAINIVREAAHAVQDTGHGRVDPDVAATIAARVIDSIDGFKTIVHELSADEAVAQLPKPDPLM